VLGRIGETDYRAWAMTHAQARNANAIPLARVPTRWNHLVEKNSRRFNGLSMIFSQKWFPLLAFML
jgi:hypothetical protein